MPIRRARDSYEVRQMLRFGIADLDSDRKARKSLKTRQAAKGLKVKISKPPTRNVRLSRPSRGAKKAKGQYEKGGLRPASPGAIVMTNVSIKIVTEI